MADEIHDNEMSIFEPAPSDTAVYSREWIQFRPSNQITEGSAIEFSIAQQSAAYMDLKRSILNIKFRLVDENNAPLDTNVVAGPVNLTLHSLFSQVDFALQQNSVSHLGTTYPYKAYIDTILNTNEMEQHNILTSQLFYKDVKNHDDNDAKTGSNLGLFKRYKRTQGGKIIDLEGPILLDLFQQNRLIVNGVSLSLKLWPSRNSFSLITDILLPNIKVQIVDACFKLCIHRPNSAVLVAHSEMMKKELRPTYPYFRSDIKVASIPTGQYNFSVDDLYLGLVPNRFIVGLVSSSSYSGNYGTSPFNFKHYDCNSMGLFIDGQSYPSKPLRPDYANENYVDCYRTLTTFRQDVNITRDEYKMGYALYVFDINPFIKFNVKKRGHCRLAMSFSKPSQKA